MLTAQQVILNTKGERIVVYPDGSWRYYERADSSLMAKTLMKEDVITPETEWKTLEKQPMNPVNDADVSGLATRFAERVAITAAEARRTLTKSVEDKFEAEARLNQAQENRKLIEPDILANLDEVYKAKTEAVKYARKHLKWMEKMDARAKAVLKVSVEKKPAKLNKLVARFDAYLEKQGVPPQRPETSVTGTSTKSLRQETSSRTRETKTEEVATPVAFSDRMYKRAPVQCKIVRPHSNAGARSTVMVEKQQLFTHTDDELRPYFRDQELVTCFASLMQIENNLYLSLEFHVASPDARKNFGILENNSMLRLKLIDGTFINLFNTHADHGKIDAYTGHTLYSGNYLIDRGTERVLRRSELDKLRVVWSSGFEDYDVVHLDFLINQFACLRSEVE